MVEGGEESAPHTLGVRHYHPSRHLRITPFPISSRELNSIQLNVLEKKNHN